MDSATTHRMTVSLDFFSGLGRFICLPGVTAREQSDRRIFAVMQLQQLQRFFATLRMTNLVFYNSPSVLI